MIATTISDDYLKDNNVESNKEILALKKRADDGDVQAMIQFANILEKGDDVPMDLPKASEYYQNAANNGNADGDAGHTRVQGKISQRARDTCSKISDDVKSIKMKAGDGDVQAMLKYADIMEKED